MAGRGTARLAGLARGAWPVALAATMALGALLLGALLVPSDRQAAEALEESGMTTEAVRYRLRLAGQAPADPQVALKVSEAFVLAGEQARALATLEAYLARNPDQVEVLREAARLAEWELRPDRAAVYRARLAELDHEDKTNLRWLGEYYLWRQRVQDSADAYLALHELDPEDGPTALRTADVLVWAGRYREAAEVLEEAAAHDPDQLAVFMRMGRAYRLAREPEKAIEAYVHAVELDHDNLLAWLELAALYTQTGQEDKAREAVENVERLTGQAGGSP